MSRSNREARAVQPADALWRVVVADDEPLARLRIRSLLSLHPQFEIVAECGDGNETLVALEQFRPHVLFLDIRMPELDGIAVAEAVGATAGADAYTPVIVFVTAYDAHAVAAFDLDAIDYLVKPVDVDRFARMLARLESRLVSGGEHTVELTRSITAALETLREMHGARRYAERIAIRSLSGATFVAVEEIDRVDADGNYVGLWTAGRRHLHRESMSRLMERLDPSRFVRVHRSAIVAINRIQRVEPNGHGEHIITLSDGSKVETSRTYSEQVQQLLR